jgi:hypothetical protein
VVPQGNWDDEATRIVRGWIADNTPGDARGLLYAGILAQFIQDNGLDDSEYFGPHPTFHDYADDWRGKELYTKETHWLAVYWVVGGSEGYYVHVDRIDYEKRELVFLGKFWGHDEAMWATILVSRLINAW